MAAMTDPATPSISITARGLVSALGHGLAATADALAAGRSGLVACDFAGQRRGFIGRVEGVESHRLPARLAAFECRNHRLAHLALDADGFAAAVGAAARRHGPGRVAVVLGTSTSGVLASEEAYRARDAVSGALPDWLDFEHTHDLGALPRFVRAALGLAGPAFTVSTACASSAQAVGLGTRLIAAGIADAAVVGGADSLCGLTLAGFAALDLIAAGPCRPGDAARDGLSIGEAAGFLLLERAEAAAPDAFALLGWGASSDGYHLSAPRPDGAGAALAMRAALDAAGLAPGAIDWINLHGTGTPANDAAEDQAVFAVFADSVPASSTKAYTGHTLGAAGIVEAILATLAIEHGLVPAPLNLDRTDPSFRVPPPPAEPGRPGHAQRERPVRRVLSNSFGFGGSNCCLVLGRPDSA